VEDQGRGAQEVAGHRVQVLGQPSLPHGGQIQDFELPIRVRRPAGPPRFS